jgi:cytochrome c-type biogenesis protein
MKGVGLLFIFGVGLTLPFVIAAFFIKPFLKFAARFRRHMGLVEKVMGLLMLTFALLLITNRINEIANWMIETFPAFTSL